jgi:glycosyltransferase involved in cell wall biosynthesis
MSQAAYRTEANPASGELLRVFVLLAHTFGASNWKERWERGEVTGIQERMPYGYFHCASDNCQVRYAEHPAENLVTNLLRLCVRRLLGFDLIHAWRNRKEIARADVVWTHTELEHLAVLLLFRLGLARKRRPRLIAQSVWLFDRWNHFSALKRWGYRRLLERADILTVLSPENLRIARELFPAQRSELVLFGIDSSRMRPAQPREVRRPIRILSLGNDLHRNWKTLIDALGGWSECEVKIGGLRVGRQVRRWMREFGNFEIVTPKTVRDTNRLYEWADFVVISLKENFHASGITVMNEAVLSGVPVICTDTGGLRAYFSDEEVRYVPLEQPQRLREAIEELAQNAELRLTMTRRAQARVVSGQLDSRSYAWRNYEISRSLLEPRGLAPVTSAASAAGVRVFVFLGHGFGGRYWEQRWASGKIAGINERLPYGFFHAGGGGWTIEYSEDQPEHRLIKYLRSGLRLVLGFDLIHARRNRHSIHNADVIWTSTEFEYLAALLLLWRRPRGRRPQVIAESVWLFDRWSRWWWPRRWFYRSLIAGADAMVVHSPKNLRVARALFPGKRVELIRFGIAADAVKPAEPRETHHPLRIVALGNDIHRDWRTLIDAVKTIDECQVRIGGKRIRWRTRGRTRGVRQIVMRRSTSAAEVTELYDQADLVVVPLKRNMHASGITAVSEAVARGVPVICTDTGGLKAYFSDAEVCYVAPGDSAALKKAILELAGDPDLRFNLVKRAQARIGSNGLSSCSYAMRHRALSLDLLSAARNHRASPMKPIQKSSATDATPRVFVFLGHGFGASWARGELPGINEVMPYGYHHGREEGCIVTYSEDAPEGSFLRLMRLGLRKTLGFDMIHAWRNRNGLRDAHVIWTHTELESLAALAFLLTRRGDSRPRVIAQSIWLFGRWQELSKPKHWLYQRLLRRADILTVQCEANRTAARRLFPAAHVQVVPFGTDIGKVVPVKPRPVHRPIRILSLGRDMHRDWATLIAAVGNLAEFEVRIGARKIDRSLAKGGSVTLIKPSSAQVAELYQWADLVVISLKPNIHVSGITVLTEAALFGVPVVCTDTGGLQEYFDDKCVRYVPVGDPEAMRLAINELANDDRLRFELATNAQARLIEGDLSTRARARKLADLTHALLANGVGDNRPANSSSPASVETFGRASSGQPTSGDPS